MWRFADQADFAGELKALHRPRPALETVTALSDWGLIGLATWAVVLCGWVAVPFALLLIGNRQRALGNLLHDTSHRSGQRRRAFAGILANMLFYWPLWVSPTLYREEHARHHRHLGDPALDPDYIHDASRSSVGWWCLWRSQVFSLAMCKANVSGHLFRMRFSTLACVSGWWLITLALLTGFFGAVVAALFLILWLAARLSVFHPITAFREISDHVGLQPGTLIGFSRNHPFRSFAAEFFHPHNNGYHLLHHLAPGIPFHALPRAHALLVNWPAYAAGEQCRSYFLGQNSAVRSWTGVRGASLIRAEIPRSVQQSR